MPASSRPPPGFPDPPHSTPGGLLLQAPTVPCPPSAPLISCPGGPLPSLALHLSACCLPSLAITALHARAPGFGFGLPKSSSLNTVLAHPSLGSGDSLAPAKGGRVICLPRGQPTPPATVAGRATVVPSGPQGSLSQGDSRVETAEDNLSASPSTTSSWVPAQCFPVSPRGCGGSSSAGKPPSGPLANGRAPESGGKLQASLRLRPSPLVALLLQRLPTPLPHCETFFLIPHC